jgi:eukaryotic-like serine/threonine-protein kinase
MTEAERFEQVCTIFEAVRELPLQEQQGMLDKLCTDDDELRDEVESMLGVHRVESPLDQSSDKLLIDRIVDAATSEHKPEIDRYEIGERLGAGGMGVVYRAQMRKPERAVAIKVIRLGMDTEGVLARFELERRALARMEHPNIASVLDAGVTRDGRPYFAMELVRGESIVNYCDTHSLDTSARLRLFIQVCHAIQHAHQKGIIHRDIKPSNVIVAEHDGAEVPKVIDFGIAKATQGDMMPDSTMTMHSHAIGTPAYMSPEQADYTLGDVDTRTDVYSLGVLLYELLTGSTPLTHEELTGKNYQEMIECIREKDPPRPSVRVSTWAKTGESAPGRVGSIEPGRLRGDLDWIVMKCLEKDQSRRYDTVRGLSDDIEHHLRNEPVLARPASRVYLAQKFVRRHRGQVIAVSALLLVLVLGVIGTSIGMAWALDEQAKAQELAESEYAAQLEATAAAERAVLEAKTAEDLSRFFIMDVLSAADPSRTTDRELTVREALTNASENIEGKFNDRPDVESRIHNALGFLFGQLGAPELAEQHHIREWEIAEEENGELSIDAARMMHSVVGSLARQGRDADAIELTRRQLRVIEELGTPEAEMLRPRAVGNLGALLVRTGRYDEAAPILEETLVLKRELYGDRHPTTLSTLNNLSSVLADIGELDRAIELAAESHEGRVEVLGMGDPRTFVSLLNYASALTEADRFDESLPLLKDGVTRAHDQLGTDHPTSIDITNTYVKSLIEHDDLETSEEIAHDNVLESIRIDPQMMQVRTHTAHTLIASSLNKQLRHDEALEYTTKLITTLKANELSSSIFMPEYLRIHGKTLTALNQYDEAEGVLMEAWDLAQSNSTEDSKQEVLLTAIVELYNDWHRAEPSAVTEEKLRRWNQLD